MAGVRRQLPSSVGASGTENPQPGNDGWLWHPCLENLQWHTGLHDWCCPETATGRLLSVSVCVCCVCPETTAGRVVSFCPCVLRVCPDSHRYGGFVFVSTCCVCVHPVTVTDRVVSFCQYVLCEPLCVHTQSHLGCFHSVSMCCVSLCAPSYR